jgi:hypothetical protein
MLELAELDGDGVADDVARAAAVVELNETVVVGGETKEGIADVAFISGTDEDVAQSKTEEVVAT